MSTARDLMNRTVVSLERTASVREAAEHMVRARVGSVIATAEGYPVGILTETDVVRLAASGTDIASVRIEDVMSSPLFSTGPDEDLLGVAATMTQSKIKKMPVMEGQRIVGMITQTDIVHYTLQAIEAAHRDLTRGELSHNEFSQRATELFRNVPKMADAVKEWHMRCVSCGTRFLAEERNGKLSTEHCPRCGGTITYDLAPPI